MKRCNTKLRLPSGRFFNCGELEKINKLGKVEKILCKNCSENTVEVKK